MIRPRLNCSKQHRRTLVDGERGVYAHRECNFCFFFLLVIMVLLSNDTLRFRALQRSLRLLLPGRVQERRSSPVSPIDALTYTETFAPQSMNPAGYITMYEGTVIPWSELWIANFLTIRQPFIDFLSQSQPGAVRFQIEIEGQMRNVETNSEWDFDRTTQFSDEIEMVTNIVELFGGLFGFDYIVFDARRITIRAFTAGAVGLGSDWVQNKDKYFIVSFRSTTNCLLHALLFAFRATVWPKRWLYEYTFEESKKKISHASRDLKRKVLVKEYADIDWSGILPLDALQVLQKHAHYGLSNAQFREHKPKIRIFNNVFHLARQVPGSSQGVEIEIMVQANHALAMVSKESVRKRLTEEQWQEVERRMTVLSYASMDSVGAAIQLIESKDILNKGLLEDIMGREFDHPRTRRRMLQEKQYRTDHENRELDKLNNMLEKPSCLGAWDIETYCRNSQIQFSPYAVMYYFVDNKEQVYERMIHSDTEDQNILLEMMRAIHTDMLDHHVYDLVLYAHNGSKFDMLACLDRVVFTENDCPWKIDFQVEQHGAFTSLTVRSVVNPKITLTFRDSMKIFGPCSLADLAKSFKVPHQKLKDAYAHSDVDWRFIQTKRDLISKYLYNDVLSLYEIMVACRKEIRRSFNIDVLSCMTGASLSKAIFFEWFYDPRKQKLYELPHKIEKIIRRAYFGGRTEVGWQKKVEGKIYMYDVTSLYPYAALNDLPAGRPEILEAEQTRAMMEEGSFFGFVVCRVKSVPEDEQQGYFRPLHGCRARNRLVFPIFEDWTEIVLFSEEIVKAKQYGYRYEYDYLQGLSFKRYPVLRDFMLTATRRKAEADARGDSVGRTMSKLVANSGYGWPAVRVDNKSCFHIYPKDKNMVAKHFVRNELISFCDRGEYQVIRTKEDLPIRNHNVALSAAITSYARMQMHEIIYEIEKKGEQTFYWDTDSVATSADLSKYPDLMEKFAWDGIRDLRKMGAELGSLKNEADGIYQKNNIPLEGMAYFDRAIFLLPKLYILEKVLPDGRTYQKGASKGISRKKPITLRLDDSLWDDQTQIGWVEQGKAVDMDRQPLVLNSNVCNERGECCNLKREIELDAYGRPVYRGAPSFEEMEQLLQGAKLYRANTSFARPMSSLLKESFTEDLLRVHTMQRSIQVQDENGTNRYMKGRVQDNGFIAPLHIPADDNAYVPVFTEEEQQHLLETCDVNDLNFDDLIDYARAQSGGRMEQSKYEKWVQALKQAIQFEQLFRVNEQRASEMGGQQDEDSRPDEQDENTSDSEVEEEEDEDESCSEVSESIEEFSEDGDIDFDEENPEILIRDAQRSLEDLPGLHHIVRISEDEIDSDDCRSYCSSDDDDDDEECLQPRRKKRRKMSRFIDDAASESEE